MNKRIFEIIVIFFFISTILPVSETMNIMDVNAHIISKSTILSREKDYWALLVGVGIYENRPEMDRWCTSPAVEDLYETLLASDYWKEDHIKILTGENATALNIIKGLFWLDEMDDEDDICLVYFCAHGGPGIDLPPFDEEDRHDEYLSTYRSFKYNIPFLRIWDDELNYFLSRLESEGVCVIIDSCYAGGFNDPPGVSVSGKGRVTLMASQEDEGAYWGFSQYVTQGLKGFADTNGDGLCSAEEVFAYAKPLVESLGFSHPTIYDDYPGELFLTEVRLPPSNPEKPAGPEIGETGIEYTYSTTLVEPNGESVRYLFDWGDGTVEITKFVQPWEVVNLSHVWDYEGTYNIAVRAQNEHGAKGNWSRRLAVTVSSENIIDQRQTKKVYGWDDWSCLLISPQEIFFLPIRNNVWIAQSFKPSLDVLSKVELELWVFRTFTPVAVSIRDELYGDDLTEASWVPYDTTGYLKTRWFSFDFPDIQVNPERTYYIVVKGSCKLPRLSVASPTGSEDPYPKGGLYYSTDRGKSWHDSSDFGIDVDICFVTLGRSISTL